MWLTDAGFTTILLSGHSDYSVSVGCSRRSDELSVRL
jgi:hypothetical protein